METQKAVALIAEVLDVLVGHFNPDCGGDFVPEHGSWNDESDISCGSACEFYHQCKQMSKAREINSKLQSLVADKGYRLNAAYAEGFKDADRGVKLDNPYNSTRETDLFAQYNRGYFDGAV